jgi:TrkA domain protein
VVGVTTKAQELGIDIEKAKLPGFGVRQEFNCSVGRRVGVVTLKTGGRLLVVYDVKDPDSVVASVELNDSEASLLAELLGAPGATERLLRLQEQVDGIITANVGIPGDSPYVGKTLGDAGIRSRTGASIVAVFRDDHVVASPTPTFVFEVDDRVVIVGTDEGVAAATHILAPH